MKTNTFHHFEGQRDAIPYISNELNGKPLGEPKISTYTYYRTSGNFTFMVGSQLYEHFLTPGFRRSIANFAILKTNRFRRKNPDIKLKSGKKEPPVQTLFKLLRAPQAKIAPWSPPKGGRGEPNFFSAPQAENFLKCLFYICTGGHERRRGPLPG